MCTVYLVIPILSSSCASQIILVLSSQLHISFSFSLVEKHQVCNGFPVYRLAVFKWIYVHVITNLHVSNFVFCLFRRHLHPHPVQNLNPSTSMEPSYWRHCLTFKTQASWLRACSLFHWKNLWPLPMTQWVRMLLKLSWRANQCRQRRNTCLLRI